MRDVVYLDEIEQAEVLLKPQRIEVLRQLAEPRSCTEVAVELGQTPQRVYYHVKRLLEAGLLRQVVERRVRGIHEGIYQAAGRSYWLSPGLVGRIGLRQTRDRLSLGYLLDLMEGVQADIAALDRTRPDLPSIGVSGDIRVRPEQRTAFLDDLRGRCRTCSRATAVPTATRSVWPSPAIRREIPMIEPDLRLRAVVQAPPKVVYEALTDPAALHVWLAEHADVDLPGKYEFWGRYTPDGAEPHQRMLQVDERTIRFAWTVDGVETTAQFELAEDEGGTLVTLSQSDLPSFQDVLADTAGSRGALQTFWSLAIANLADYLSGRELTPKCDFTSAELHASVVIDAAPEQVFDSMIQPEQFRRWFGANVDIEPYVGGRFAMGGFELDPGSIKFVEFEPGRKATLRYSDGMTDSWELEGSNGKTRLTVVESGFDPANPPYPGWVGWLSGIAALRRYHELPQWRTIWRQIEIAGVPEGMLSSIDQ